MADVEYNAERVMDQNPKLPQIEVWKAQAAESQVKHMLRERMVNSYIPYAKLALGIMGIAVIGALVAWIVWAILFGGLFPSIAHTLASGN